MAKKKKDFNYFSDKNRDKDGLLLSTAFLIQKRIICCLGIRSCYKYGLLDMSSEVSNPIDMMTVNIADAFPRSSKHG